MGDHDRGQGYQPLSVARLGALLAGTDESRRWRLIAEFLEEYRWEPLDTRWDLLAAKPPGTGNERWDVFLAGKHSARGLVWAGVLLSAC